MNTSERYTYEIIVEGQLDPQWAEWFGDFELRTIGQCTRLSGDVPDQAALFGVLKKLHSLGLVLIFVVRISVPSSEEGKTHES